ncbi:TPA: ribonuclease HIII [Staphylococcus aureus]|uniref:Ribonuclease HIII n=1 Tax=Staphylococcus aureus TaxID=1280 RepID=A0AA40JKN6_STAAU|nr:ribonuclease HIII [Staphylococcus aureus]KIT95655.1 ribonuclease HIII [Staphylococcus aureus]MBH4490224.1 ribonuclease HIII [Staphylococcus aureus]MCO4431177.1 ribonuclease HIII [Staphylococcus aureus]OQO32923.1 ribonuclease HIII [Staphylococcus aureus]URH54195.1 ribonuclease HIII [Staphylococcus aureus]
MANIVFKLSDKDITTLMSRISFDTENLPQGMKARAKYQNTTVNIYQSGKVMFQGNHAEAVSEELLPQHSQLNTNKTKKKNMANSFLEQTLMYDQFNCIGSDEAGSGDYFGPLTVCAAFVTKEHVPILKTLGVDDSKKLTDTKIVELAEQLVTFIPHSLLTLHNEKYNIQQAKGWTQVKMKAVLHNEAIKNVLKKIDSSQLDYIVIDQFAKREVYSHYALSDIPLPKKTKFETKGESKSLAIAVASIISRYAFVTYMDKISKNINMTIPKGAGAKVDVIAAKIIKKYGLSRLDTISKKHFKNREKAQKILKPL